jgi:DNA-binding beta-propeller fold protein YncE
MTTPSPLSSASLDPSASPTPSAGPLAKQLYVFNGVANSIDRIDTATRRLTATGIGTGVFPNQLVTDGVASLLVVSGPSEVLSLDLQGGKAVSTLRLPENWWPQWLAPYKPGQGVIVGSQFGYPSELAWLDLSKGQVEATASVPQGNAYQIACSSGKVYVPATDWDYSANPPTFSGVHVYDVATRTRLSTIPLTAVSKPNATATAPDGKVWVAGETDVYRIDPASDTVVNQLPVGERVAAFAFEAPNGYAVLQGGGLVSFKMDGSAMLRGAGNKMPGGDFALVLVDGKVWSCDFGRDRILVTDPVTGLQVGDPIPAGDGPQGLLVQAP